MKTSFIQFAGDESGVTAIEYGMIAGLISIGIVTAVTSIGTTISATFFGAVAAGFK
jgi:pilus assembly protein Flp/PilA